MSDRPVRLVVADDLVRSRLTVFFRLLLAIPHFIWFGLWSSAVFFTAFAQWVITVVRGRPAAPLHSFHVHFIRYAAHVTAYVTLVANRFPGLLGLPGYEVDVEVDAVGRQHRLSAFFRLLLAFPALVFASSLAGALFVYGSGLLAAVALLGWFAALARGRMPRGLRNIGAYAIRYVADTSAYVLLVTRRYPTTDPTLPSPAGAPPPHAIRLEVADERKRSRLTTFFRFPLTTPHFIWLLLWAVAAVFAIVANWFVTLVRGTPAQPLHRFLTAFLRYQTHVLAFLWMVANPFPGFTGTRRYPVQVDVDAPRRQNRWITGFRLLLAFPAFIVNSALNWVLVAAGVGGWFAALATGRMPKGLRNAGAHALRYNAQTNGYAWLLTDRYPFSGPPAEAAAEEPPAAVPDAAPA